jgi:hypothetical protein
MLKTACLIKLMEIKVKNAEEYVNIILNDERENIVSEMPTEYCDDKIERIYEFADGAFVKYEWQSSPTGRTSRTERYNHRFTLIKLPSLNSNGFKEGIIKVINYTF